MKKIKLKVIFTLLTITDWMLRDVSDDYYEPGYFVEGIRYSIKERFKS